MLLNLALWIGGVVLLGIGLYAIRTPAARSRELRQTDANLARYDSWRGGSRTAVDRGTTGADVMREQMRQKVRLWSIVIVVGIALIVVGFLIR
ncbi:MAG: hypothetical protein ABIZ34_05920 [Candidatus Limnocylindrales bacterium]